MRKITQAFFDAALRRHKEWLKDVRNGKRLNFEKCDLTALDMTGANMTDAIMSGATMTRANMTGTNMTRAIMTGAIMARANMAGANMTGAIMVRANMPGAIMSGANMTDVNMTDAIMTRAVMTDANMTRAVMTDAIMVRANMTRAIMTGAIMDRANMTDAIMTGAILPHFAIVPEEGTFIAFKKVYGAVLKIEVPATARRTSSLVGRKCRAEFVRVLEAVSGDTNAPYLGLHDDKTQYIPGKITTADSFDGDIRVECTHGIHFFMTRQEAEEYS
jgi:hypothetical protein